MVHGDSQPRSAGAGDDAAAATSATPAPRCPICSITSSSPTIRRSRTIIDDRALSETSPIRAYTDDKRNYIQWLIDAAPNSLDTLREEAGFTGQRSPAGPAVPLSSPCPAARLLQLQLQLPSRRRISRRQTDLLAMRTEPSFVHIAEAPGTSESRFAALYKTESRITGSPTLLVSDYIRQQLGIAPAAADLAAQIAALKILDDASHRGTGAAFRRAHRHVLLPLRRMAAGAGQPAHRCRRRAAAAAGTEQAGAGLYLGAYAWVEDLHPSTDQTCPVSTSARVSQQQFPGTAPLLTDRAEWRLHSRAVDPARRLPLRSSRRISRQRRRRTIPDDTSVNLSSDRVRVALSLIEGIRNGQSLGALLGYQFELWPARRLSSSPKWTSSSIRLRKAFPLVADAMASTQTDPNVPIEAIEARNVLDGKKLVDQIKAAAVSATTPIRGDRRACRRPSRNRADGAQRGG